MQEKLKIFKLKIQTRPKTGVHFSKKCSQFFGQGPTSYKKFFLLVAGDKGWLSRPPEAYTNM
jgi:hypothetical protein